jgi:hypothetical protein
VEAVPFRRAWGYICSLLFFSHHRSSHVIFDV